MQALTFGFGAEPTMALSCPSVIESCASCLMFEPPPSESDPFRNVDMVAAVKTRSASLWWLCTLLGFILSANFDDLLLYSTHHSESNAFKLESFH